MSVHGPISSPVTCSGAMYDGVPINASPCSGAAGVVGPREGRNRLIATPTITVAEHDVGALEIAVDHARSMGGVRDP